MSQKTRKSGHKPSREAKEKTEEFRKLRGENQKLRKELARIKRELDKRYSELDNTLSDEEAKIEVKPMVTLDDKCTVCGGNYMSMKMPSNKILLICNDCGKRKVK